MLPHNFLERYFVEIEAAVTQLPAYAESYVEEILTSERANSHTPALSKRLPVGN